MRYARLIAGLLLLIVLTACFGPSPVVIRQDLQPPADASQPYLLHVTVQNNSGGEGEVEITARLHARSSDITAAQAISDVTLDPHETLDVVLQLQAAQLGDYVPSVDVEYPPR